MPKVSKYIYYVCVELYNMKRLSVRFICINLCIVSMCYIYTLEVVVIRLLLQHTLPEINA